MGSIRPSCLYDNRQTDPYLAPDGYDRPQRVHADVAHPETGGGGAVPVRPHVPGDIVHRDLSGCDMHMGGMLRYGRSQVVNIFDAVVSRMWSARKSQNIC